MQEIKEVSKYFVDSFDVLEKSTKLLTTIDEKIRIIKELELLSNDLQNYTNKEWKPFSLPMTKIYSNTPKLGPCDIHPLSPDSLKFHNKSPLKGGIMPDLRKLAMKNSANSLLTLNDATESPTRGSSKFIVKDASLSIESPVRHSSEDSFTDFIDTKKIHCYSPVLPHRKPFDPSEIEEHIQILFTELNKPHIKRKSMNDEIFIHNEYEKDQRLNQSCSLDYTLYNSYFKKKKITRCNSVCGNVGYKPEIGITAKGGNQMNIDDFEIIKGISSGAYGKVCLVKKKTSGDYFAMKIIDKEKTIEKSQEDLIKSEVTIMRKLDNDYIVKLYYSFQNTQYLFFVMEYMNGGDLGHLLQKVGALDAKFARLYAAEVILALKHLHSNGIIHRDLKPDNILIDSTGHLKVTDFGLSKGKISEKHKAWILNYYRQEIKDPILKKSSSNDEISISGSNSAQVKLAKNNKKKIVGSPHYIAPELIKDGKSSYAIDWWALGIILFEMMVGSVPYTGNTAEEVLDNIVNDVKDIELDIGQGDDQISPEAADLITKLMDRNYKRRLSFAENSIKSHPFFDGINWENLRFEEAPFVPETANITDTAYFGKHKEFSPGDYSGRHSENGTIRRKSSLLGFDFDTLNVKSLAKKNKEDAINAIRLFGSAGKKARTKKSIRKSKLNRVHTTYN